MKYPEWYEKYVKGKELEGKIKAAHNKEADKAQFQKYKAIPHKSKHASMKCGKIRL